MKAGLARVNEFRTQMGDIPDHVLCPGRRLSLRELLETELLRKHGKRKPQAWARGLQLLFLSSTFVTTCRVRQNLPPSFRMSVVALDKTCQSPCTMPADVMNTSQPAVVSLMPFSSFDFARECVMHVCGHVLDHQVIKR